jgi:hypothetical protein
MELMPGTETGVPHADARLRMPKVEFRSDDDGLTLQRNTR